MALKWREVHRVRDPQGSTNHAVPVAQTDLVPGSTAHKRRSNGEVAVVAKVTVSQARLLMVCSGSIWMFSPLVSGVVNAVPGGSEQELVLALQLLAATDSTTATASGSATHLAVVYFLSG